MWKEKKKYNQLFKKFHYVKDLNVDRIMNDKEFKTTIGNNYSLCRHLIKRVKENQQKRRDKSLFVRHNKKENKINELLYLLEKYPDKKDRDFWEILGIKKTYFYSLKKEVKFRQKNIELELKLKRLENDLKIWVFIRERLIKEKSFKNLSNWEKGKYIKIKRLFNKTSKSFNSIYSSRFIYLNLQSEPLNLHKIINTDINNLQQEIDFWTDNLDFDYDLSSEDFWEKSVNTIKLINKLEFQIFIKKLFEIYE